MKKKSDEVESELQFPLQGLDERRSYSRQKSGTTADAQNLRSFDPLTDRSRGGMRPGLTKFMPTRLVTGTGTDGLARGYPIQDLNSLVATTSPPPDDFAQFIHALNDVNDTFGIRDGADGSAIATAGQGSASGYAFACSCWDDEHNAYVAEVKTGDNPAPVTIYKISKAGVILWTSTSPFFVATGSLRNVAGMCVVNQSANSTVPQYLFVAVAPASGTAYIHRLQAASGAVNALQWQQYDTSTQHLTFSTGSHNCLGKIGTTLGVESAGSATNQGFRTYNALASSQQAPLTYTAWGGTLAQQATRVVSDGVSSFYVIASVSTNMVKKISAGGVIDPTWAYSSASIATGLALDTNNTKLVATYTTTPSVRSLNPVTGAVSASADPDLGAGAVTNFSEIDTDSQGTFVIYRNGVAALDVAGINTSLTVLWQKTLANTTHSGSSVNKGDSPPISPEGVRIVRLLGVSNGEVRRFDTSGSVALTGGASFSVAAKVVWSAQLGLNMFYVDGGPYRYYKSTTDAMTAWSPTDGTMPVDALGRRARLMCVWDGRIVMAGVLGNPQNFYMSAQYLPFNWDYAPTTTTATQAFAGNNDVAGELGELINCLLPYSDDTMIFGCDSSIWQMSGNPMAGGRLDRIASSLGMAFGRPFAFDPSGQFVYFFGTDCRVHKMAPGGNPTIMTQQINRRLLGIDLSENLIRLAWDRRNQGLAVWVSPYDASATTENYFWEMRTDAWWPDFYGAPRLNPLAIHVYDGDEEADRKILLGGRDGYIRYVDETASTDDGVLIEWFALLGPLQTPMLDELQLMDLQATLGEDSGTINYEVFAADTPEAAFRATVPDDSGSWEASWNNASYLNVAGKAIYVTISGTTPMALERLIARYRILGSVRRRS